MLKTDPAQVAASRRRRAQDRFDLELWEVHRQQVIQLESPPQPPVPSIVAFIGAIAFFHSPSQYSFERLP